MTRRERIRKALAFEQADFVPWHINLTIPARRKVAEYFGIADDRETVDEALGNHVHHILTEPPDAWVEERPGFWRDEFGVLWDRTVDQDIGNPCELVLPEPTLEGYDWPNPVDPVRFGEFPPAFRREPEMFVVADFGFSLFERAWTMRGMENLLMDMVLNEQFVHNLFRTICDWNLECITKVLEWPVDAVLTGDDWGQQQGLIMGPELWHKFILPHVTRMYKLVRDAGRKVFIHSCGKVDELFDDLVGIGVNCFNPFQPEVMDTFALAKRYKGRLAFFGGISVQSLLPYGSPGEVRAEVAHIIKEIGAGGGYIAAPSHDTPKDVPIENIIAMWEVLRDQ